MTDLANQDVSQATICEAIAQSAETETPLRRSRFERWHTSAALACAAIGVALGLWGGCSALLDHAAGAATQRTTIQDTQTMQGQNIEGINKRLDGFDERLGHVEQNQVKTLTSLDWIKGRLK